MEITNTQVLVKKSGKAQYGIFIRKRIVQKTTVQREGQAILNKTLDAFDHKNVFAGT